jgi:uncharacterized protein YsxB (DUF464 family)
MISAKFSGNFTEFDISGHAESASKGQDVPCAAVSSAVMLSVNIINAVSFFGKGKAKTKKNQVIFKGKGRNTILVVKSLYLHLQEIEKEFPKNIKVEVVV